jgi:hypothetical protein
VLKKTLGKIDLSRQSKCIHNTGAFIKVLDRKERETAERDP